MEFPLRIALLQINPTAGDLAGNSALIVDGVKRAREQDADLVVTPELALMGYLPRDLLMSRGFVRKSGDELARIAAELKDAPPALIGVATPAPGDMGRPLYNSAVLIQDGRVGPAFHKTLLPTYDVFDEDRYFEPARENSPAQFNGAQVGLTICEDIWNDEDFWPERRYQHNPPMELVAAGSRILFNISASP